MALFITGDVHGKAYDLAARARAAGAGRGDEVLVLGDLGLAYGHRFDVPRVTGLLAQLARSAEWTLVVMRGNHDVRYERDLVEQRMGEQCRLGSAEPVEWNGGPAWRLSRIGAIVLPDAGGAYDIEGVRTLVAPGAWSIDGRYRRINGLPFEREEMLTAEELAALARTAEQLQPECVLSNTCPASWRAEMVNLLIDQDLWTDDTMEETFQRILEGTPSIRRWAFGHFHGDRRVGGGIGRLMYYDIAPFSQVVEGTDEVGARGPLDAPESWMEVRERAASIVGAMPSRMGYSTRTLPSFLGCDPQDVDDVLRYETMNIEERTGDRMATVAQVEMVIHKLYNGGGMRHSW